MSKRLTGFVHLLMIMMGLIFAYTDEFDVYVKIIGIVLLMTGFSCITDMMFKRAKMRTQEIIKEVDALCIMEPGIVKIGFDFGFEFKKINDTEKICLMVNGEEVILGKGQSCLFKIKSNNIQLNLKVTPDFKKKICDITCDNHNLKFNKGCNFEFNKDL